MDPPDWSRSLRFVRAGTHLGVVIRELIQNRELAEDVFDGQM